jgi:predicted neuraminidase
MLFAGVASIGAAAHNQAVQVPTGAFIAARLPTTSAHASTIAEDREGIVAAWFGGTREGAPDVGIWFSRLTNGTWTTPVEIANGVQPDGPRFACYNPVLFVRTDGTLDLFYKVGRQPALWWGMRQHSTDGGRTWSRAERLPDGFLGPIKNKPVRLASGRIIAPSSTESPDADAVWAVHFELSDDNGATWTKVAPPAGATRIDAIQPSILTYPDGRLQALGRSRSSRVFETWSRDSGRTWSALALTALPNPNSGLDAVTLRDGRQLIVFNDATRGRTPLSVAVSRDGKTWERTAVLESGPGEFSYPAVIQARDGTVHITYTWNRTNIRHVTVVP